MNWIFNRYTLVLALCLAGGAWYWKNKANANDKSNEPTGVVERADIVQRQFQDSSSRLSDAVKRRDAVSGVNVDEELASLVIFQNSYAASARVISTTQQMYDTLLSMIR